jgi:valyl-tRNA synthetase
MKNYATRKGFTNKIWNAFKLIKGWEVSETIPQESSKVAIEWYEKCNKPY